MNFDKLDKILQSGSIDALKTFCFENDLFIKDGKIFHKDPSFVEKQIEYWEKRQLVKKINLNS